jgi:hypothetical protein
MLALEIILDFPLCGECLPTSLYMKSRAWRSVRLEAAKPTKLLLFPKLTEPRANQQGKRVQIYQKLR